jgi:hypothetical protein
MRVGQKKHADLLEGRGAAQALVAGLGSRRILCSAPMADGAALGPDVMDSAGTPLWQSCVPSCNCVRAMRPQPHG